MVIVGLLAGRGVDANVERVIDPILDHPYVHSLWLVTPWIAERYTQNTKLRWIKEKIEGHHLLWKARNDLMRRIRRHLEFIREPIDYVMMGDDDGLPDPDYFDALEDIPGFMVPPTLFTGRLSNFNGSRWYDICAFVGQHPVALPYDDWKNPRWDDTRYANGNQHILNMAAFRLGVLYPAVDGEDPHFCWALNKAGVRIEFVPELHMTLTRQHGPCAMWQYGRIVTVV